MWHQSQKYRFFCRHSLLFLDILDNETLLIKNGIENDANKTDGRIFSINSIFLNFLKNSKFF